MIDINLFRDKITKCFSSICVDAKQTYAHPESNSIVVRDSLIGFFEISILPHFCGGVYLSGIRAGYCGIGESVLDNLIERLNWCFIYLHEHNHCLVNYVSITDQKIVNSLLEKLGFKKTVQIINPNTGNEIIHWNLNLVEYCNNFKNEEKVLD